MPHRHIDVFHHTRSAALGPDGHTAASLRQQILDRAQTASNSEDLPAASDELAPLDSLIVKIARNAYKVVDDDIDQLLAAGRSQDEVFEIVVSAALGAGNARFDAGMNALQALQRESSGGTA